MPPIVAAFLTVGFIVFLFRRDIRERPNVTGGLWLPLIWLLIITGRPVSRWLYNFGFSNIGAVALEEGSPLDAAIYFGLIGAGLYVLNKRRVRFWEVVRDNKWLTLFLLYCLVSIVWSDFPFVAFKRWIKVIGHPVMALIILTEPDPKESLTRLMKRCAYVVIPTSILFIKYYPYLGRVYDRWTGVAANTGITLNKNGLGYDCLIVGFALFWHLLQEWSMERGKIRRNELFLTSGLLAGICWLLWKAHSSTSLVALLLGTLTLAMLRLRSVDKKLIGPYALLAVVALIVGELLFGIYGHMVNLTGRDATIAGRAELWRELLALGTNPVFGVGFESFWLGDRLQEFAELHWWHPNQAHNGYLEIYLTLGVLGLLLLIGLLIVTFWKARGGLLTDFQFGCFRLGFLVATVAYNWTEASFKGLHPAFFMFFLIAVDHRQSMASFFEETDSGLIEEPEQLAFASERD